MKEQSMVAQIDSLIYEIRGRATQIVKDLYAINKKLLPLEPTAGTKPGKEPAPQGWFEETVQKCRLVISILREAQYHANRLSEEVEAEMIVRKMPEIE